MDKLFNNRVDSVGKVLGILGDRWVFLILREAFFNVQHYDQFQSNLGIATNILSNRLKRLVENNILEKQKDELDARRIKYKLTERGLDLYPITLALMNWGDQWLADDGEQPLLLIHKKCGLQLHTAMRCSSCNEIVKAQDVSYTETGEAIGL